MKAQQSTWYGSVIAELTGDGHGSGGYMSLRLSAEDWESMGPPRPVNVAVGGRNRYGLPRCEPQAIHLTVRHGEHVGVVEVKSVVEGRRVYSIELVVQAIALPVGTRIEITECALVDPPMTLTPQQQLLRGHLHGR